MHYKISDFKTVEMYLKEHLQNKEILNDLQSASITPKYEPTIGGSGVSRTTENLATSQLEPYKQKWFDAIEMTFAYLKTSKNYAEIKELITLMYFMDYIGQHDAKYKGEKNLRIERAAERMNISVETAKRRKKLFFTVCWDFRRKM